MHYLLCTGSCGRTRATGSAMDHELDMTLVIRIEPGLPLSGLAPTGEKKFGSLGALRLLRGDSRRELALAESPVT